MGESAETRERVERWKSAWESLDVDRIVALYTPDARHESALVPKLFPEARGIALRGEKSLREYVRRGRAWFEGLEIEVLSVLEDGKRMAIEYRRHSNVDRRKPARVLELLEWKGERIRLAAVFHF
jgi:hypothetical protein